MLKELLDSAFSIIPNKQDAVEHVASVLSKVLNLISHLTVDIHENKVKQLVLDEIIEVCMYLKETAKKQGNHG